MNIEEQNLIGTIENCLKEHKILLKNNDATAAFYLIEANIQGSIAKDIKDTYAEEMGDFKIKLINKIFGNKSEKQTYGLLVDQGLRYAYAFNRKLADIDRKNNTLKFKSLADVLTEDIKPQEPPSINIHPDPNINNDDYFHNDVLIRYSIIDGKSDKNNPKAFNIRFEKPSLLDRIIASQKNKSIMVKFGENDTPRKFYALEVSYKTSTLKDFLKTYGEKLKNLETRMAEKILGFGKTENTYLVLLQDRGETLQIAYAFNKKFTEYLPKKQKIEFKDPQEFLLANIPQNKEKKIIADTLDKLKKAKPFKAPAYNPRKDSYNPRKNTGYMPRGNMLIRYAIIGKEEQS